MKQDSHVSPDHIRSAFSSAMSIMYREEVPAYGVLTDLVARTNAETLAMDANLRHSLESTDSLSRISEERHGAIRLGLPAELSMIRRGFAVMGMYPVGYYDLSTSGVPVHSTAFRPIRDAALKHNPFRVFTSLLRLDLIADEPLRAEAEAILRKRQIFTPGAVELIETSERDGGLNEADAKQFVAELLETFRWHHRAHVGADLYRRLHNAHRLVADVVSFKGPHINHLTPRALDIDRVQTLMPEYGITPKAVVEGPPRRNCAILLRQTSFKAIEEPVFFRTTDSEWTAGSHTARFGEIEQRGIALTPKGRGLYDRLLDEFRASGRPAADETNAQQYQAALSRQFETFPDSWTAVRAGGLGYFRYFLTEKGRQTKLAAPRGLDALISDGLIDFDPITYEDFLPVSAAGIFQSNLGDDTRQEFAASPNLQQFEVDLGASVLNEFSLYADIEEASSRSCLDALLRM